MDLLCRSCLIIQVCSDMSLLFLIQTCEPAVNSLVVVCSCVNNTVVDIVVRQIFIGTADICGVKCELKNLHVRETAVFHKLANALCHKAEILCDEFSLAKLSCKSIEQIHTRTVFPMTVKCFSGTCRDREVLVKTSEVIDTNHIV